LAKVLVLVLAILFLASIGIGIGNTFCKEICVASPVQLPFQTKQKCGFLIYFHSITQVTQLELTIVSFSFSLGLPHNTVNQNLFFTILFSCSPCKTSLFHIHLFGYNVPYSSLFFSVQAALYGPISTFKHALLW